VHCKKSCSVEQCIWRGKRDALLRSRRDPTGERTQQGAHLGKGRRHLPVSGLHPFVSARSQLVAYIHPKTDLRFVHSVLTRPNAAALVGGAMRILTTAGTRVKECATRLFSKIPTDGAVLNIPDGQSTVGAAAQLSCVSSSWTIAELNGPNLRLESSEFLAVYRFSNA
jgi:hypothetical protein